MSKKPYWFTARTYGWGWGLPSAWQGWVIYTVAAAALIAGFFLFPPAREMLKFQLYTWAVVLVLVLICWLKGEPPKWRWGK